MLKLSTSAATTTWSGVRILTVSTILMLLPVALFVGRFGNKEVECVVVSPPPRKHEALRLLQPPLLPLPPPSPLMRIAAAKEEDDDDDEVYNTKGFRAFATAMYANTLTSKEDLWSARATREIHGTLDATLVPITVIHGTHKRPGNLVKTLSAILSSTAWVKRVFVVMNGSPMEEEAMAAIQQVRDVWTNATLHVFRTDLEVGFYHRLLHSLVVDTSVVAVIDDDMVIGRRYLETAVHALMTKEYRGIIATRGHHVIPPQNNGYRSKRWDFYGHDTVTTMLDNAYSIYVFPAEWARFLFRETPYTYRNGEDLNFGYALRKYTNHDVVAFVSRNDDDDDGDFCGDCEPNLGNTNRSWVEVPDSAWATYEDRDLHLPAASDPFSKEYASLSHEQLRERIIAFQYMRGNAFLYTRTQQQEEEDVSLVFLTDETQARVLREMMGQKKMDIESFSFVIPGTRGTSMRNITSALGLAHLYDEYDIELGDVGNSRNHHTRFFNMRLDREYDNKERWSYADEFYAIHPHFQSILLATHPSKVYAVDDGSILSMSVVFASRLASVPEIVAIIAPSDNNNNETTPTPLASHLLRYMATSNITT